MIPPMPEREWRRIADGACAAKSGFAKAMRGLHAEGAGQDASMSFPGLDLTPFLTLLSWPDPSRVRLFSQRRGVRISCGAGNHPGRAVLSYRALAPATGACGDQGDERPWESSNWHSPPWRQCRLRLATPSIPTRNAGWPGRRQVLSFLTRLAATRLQVPSSAARPVTFATNSTYQAVARGTEAPRQAHADLTIPPSGPRAPVAFSFAISNTGAAAWSAHPGRGA